MEQHDLQRMLGKMKTLWCRQMAISNTIIPIESKEWMPHRVTTETIVRDICAIYLSAVSYRGEKLCTALFVKRSAETLMKEMRKIAPEQYEDALTRLMEPSIHEHKA